VLQTSIKTKEKIKMLKKCCIISKYYFGFILLHGYFAAVGSSVVIYFKDFSAILAKKFGHC
jgi:hypothetical protein